MALVQSEHPSSPLLVLSQSEETSHPVSKFSRRDRESPGRPPASTRTNHSGCHEVSPSNLPQTRSQPSHSRPGRLVPVVSGRSSVCFFDTLRAWASCEASTSASDRPRQLGATGRKRPLVLEVDRLPDEVDSTDEAASEPDELFSKVDSRPKNGPNDCRLTSRKRVWCGDQPIPSNCAVSDPQVVTDSYSKSGGPLLPLSAAQPRGTTSTGSNPTRTQTQSRASSASPPDGNSRGCVSGSLPHRNNPPDKLVSATGESVDNRPVMVSRGCLDPNHSCEAQRNEGVDAPQHRGGGSSANSPTTTRKWSRLLYFMAPSRFRRRFEALKQQGLYHLLCGTLPLLVLPAYFASQCITPEVARHWAISFANWLGLRSIAGIEPVILRFLNGGLLILVLLGFLTILLTALKDPGRVPRGYHWIATATSINLVEGSHRGGCAVTRHNQSRTTSEAASCGAIHQVLGTTDICAYQPAFPNSSFSPTLHLPPLLVGRLSQEVNHYPHKNNSVVAELAQSSGHSKSLVRHRSHHFTLEPAGLAETPILIPARAVRQWTEFLTTGTVRIQWENETPCLHQADKILAAGPVNKEGASYTVACDEAANPESMGLPTDVLGLVNGDVVPLKWCTICKHVRQPRTRHCRNCRCCVDRFDHHCVWVCNCVGLRNHRFFLSFVACGVFINAYLLTLSIVLFKQNWTALGVQFTSDESTRLHRITLFFAHIALTIADNPGAFAILMLAFVLILPMANLFLFHFVMLITNRTTTEEMRELHLDHNPFDMGGKKNLLWLLWKTPPPSLFTRFGRSTEIAFRRLEPSRWGRGKTGHNGVSTRSSPDPGRPKGPRSPLEDKLIEHNEIEDYA